MKFIEDHRFSNLTASNTATTREPVQKHDEAWYPRKKCSRRIASSDGAIFRALDALTSPNHGLKSRQSRLPRSEPALLCVLLLLGPFGSDTEVLDQVRAIEGKPKSSEEVSTQQVAYHSSLRLVAWTWTCCIGVGLFFSVVLPYPAFLSS